jgi:hypothetical protein
MHFAGLPKLALNEGEYFHQFHVILAQAGIYYYHS